MSLQQQIIDAVSRDDGTGICKACHHEQSYCEPDARNYTCEECGENEVFGAEEMLFEVSAASLSAKVASAK